MTSTRIAAAVVGLAVLLPALFLGGVVAVYAIVALVMLVSLDEYSRMAFPDDQRVAFVWLLLGCVALATAQIAWGDARAAATGMVVAMATSVFVTLRTGDDLEHTVRGLGRYALGLVWIGVMLPVLVRLRLWEHGVAWVMLVLVVSWFNDTGAYFSGRAFGRHKLAPVVSPKKTWEGLAGGGLAAVGGVFLLRAVALSELTMSDAVAIGVLGAAAGVMGDLAESLLKRAFHVKDSGWIMPGHGGLLDRIDSVLFVAPTVWAYMVLVHGA
ncbi:MAG: phosphatidate cytidylyltransferase [Alphaproteobacteria bacterium]|nr:phosphatidate cytidylyltransferase [Alphaproteobacteria bacterium]